MSSPCAWLMALLLPAALALRFQRRPAARAAYLATFLLLLGWFGLGKVPSRWPFHSWHLYSPRFQPAFSYADLRLADALGRELRYDARAVPASIPTPLRRLAGRLPELRPERAAELSRFLLRRANDRAGAVRAERAGRGPWRFPPHQVGLRWSPGELEGLGHFEELRVYRVDVRLSDDGRRVAWQREALAFRYP